MKVLSLFDGMSCGRIALERVGLPITAYFASELDKHAIAVARKNYPSTIQMGDVRVVREMAEAGFFGQIDLLIGGSPCQGFSFSGKQLAFDDPRSVLFFEFVRILRALQKDNPYIKFLLENVKMKKEHLDVITNFMGVAPVFINSALVSAQNRQRYYWANWKIEQPADRGILLKDIIEPGVVDAAYIISDGQLNRLKTSTDLTKSFSKIDPDKAGCMTARQYANWKGNFVTVNVSTSGRGNGKVESRHYVSDKSHTLTAIHGNYAETLVVKEYSPRCQAQILKNMKNPEEKSLAVCTNANMTGSGVTILNIENTIIRKLTPVECERLQTVPDNYTAGVSDSQRYKMLGNGWTVDVIAHIFAGLKA